MRFRAMITTTMALITGVTLFLGVPATAHAQNAGEWSIDGRGGIAVPAGDLADLSSVGGNAALGLAYWVTPRVALRVDGSVDFLTGRDASEEGILVSEVPDMTLWHYVGGVELRLTPPRETRWDVTVNVEGGAATVDTDDHPLLAAAPDGDLSFTETYFSANGGLDVGYRVSPHVSVFVGGQAYLVATDDQDTRVFSDFSSAVDPDGFSSAWTFPVQGGVSVSF